jgi:hypothetical protein
MKPAYSRRALLAGELVTTVLTALTGPDALRWVDRRHWVEEVCRLQYDWCLRGHDGGEHDVSGPWDLKPIETEFGVGRGHRLLPPLGAGRADWVTGEEQMHKPGTDAERAQPVQEREPVRRLIQRAAPVFGRLGCDADANLRPTEGVLDEPAGGGCGLCSAAAAVELLGVALALDEKDACLAVAVVGGGQRVPVRAARRQSDLSASACSPWPTWSRRARSQYSL